MRSLAAAPYVVLTWSGPLHERACLCDGHDRVVVRPTPVVARQSITHRLLLTFVDEAGDRPYCLAVQKLDERRLAGTTEVILILEMELTTSTTGTATNDCVAACDFLSATVAVRFNGHTLFPSVCRVHPAFAETYLYSINWAG